MEHVSILQPHPKRPPSAYAESVNLGLKKTFGGYFSSYEYAMLRDNFLTSTWVLVGACLQSILLYYLPGTIGLAPAFILLGWRITEALLMTVGLKRNHFMDGTIPGKWAVHFPDAAGKYTGEPSDSEVCVIILAARANHPLGMLAPNFKTIFDFFNKNVAALEADPERQGWLGMTGWLQSGDRAAGSEAMMIGYFKNVEYLHKFAHDTSHRNGWAWWNSIAKDNPYLSIMHEVYMVPKKHWEGIYINYHPTGLAATTVPGTKTVPAAGDGQMTTSPDLTTPWFSPIVEAHKGKWRSSAGRMNWDQGTGNEKYGDEPY